MRRSVWIAVLAVGCGSGSTLSSGRDGGDLDGESGDSATPIDSGDATITIQDAQGDTSSTLGIDAGGGPEGGEGGAPGPEDASDGSQDAGDGSVVDEDVAPEPEFVKVRFAQMIYDSAYDLCLIEPDGGRVGPVFGSMGVDGGLAYGQVSDYITVDLNENPELVIYQASRSCAVPGPAGWRGSVNGPPGASVTVVSYYHEDVNAGSQYGALLAVDEPTAPADEANIRAVHTATLLLGNTSNTYAVQFELGSNATFPDVPFASAAVPGGGVDSNGYALVAPFTNENVTLTDRPPPSPPISRGGGGPWSTVGGHVYSLYAVGGGTATPLRVVACDETLPLVNHLFACSFL